MKEGFCEAALQEQKQVAEQAGRAEGSFAVHLARTLLSLWDSGDGANDAAEMDRSLISVKGRLGGILITQKIAETYKEHRKRKLKSLKKIYTSAINQESYSKNRQTVGYIEDSKFNAELREIFTLTQFCKKYDDIDLFKGVVAFVNADGGDPYLGVENDGAITSIHKEYSNPIALSACIANNTLLSASARTELVEEEYPVLKISVSKG